MNSCPKEEISWSFVPLVPPAGLEVLVAVNGNLARGAGERSPGAKRAAGAMH